jgi:crotonobetainyl-CoA:carnitine CoA-transferase CaiB-like acyl-CoA transferase
VERLNARDVPSGAILGLAEALAQSQVVHRHVLHDVPVEGIGVLKLFGLTARFDKTPGHIDAPPPRLSQHTDEVLGSLGVTRDELSALKAKGVI